MPKKQPLYPHVPKSQRETAAVPLPHEIGIDEVRTLILQALDILTVGPGLKALSTGDFDKALWRLVDAAGMVSSHSSPDATGTHHHPTGRGYYVDSLVISS